MIPLKLSAHEQSVLADLAQFMSSLKTKTFHCGEDLDQNDLDRLELLVYRYEETNWGVLYDKLHRTGSNA